MLFYNTVPLQSEITRECQCIFALAVSAFFAGINFHIQAISKIKFLMKLGHL